MVDTAETKMTRTPKDFCGWNAEETADSESAGVMEEVRFELAFELKAGVFICCFVYFCFLQAGMRGRASQAGMTP